MAILYLMVKGRFTGIVTFELKCKREQNMWISERKKNSGQRD